MVELSYPARLSIMITAYAVMSGIVPHSPPVYHLTVPSSQQMGARRSHRSLIPAWSTGFMDNRMSAMAIEVKKLTRRFGQRMAVDELGFSAEPGDVVGLLGPNGAGKTTTIRLLSTVLEPTSGSFPVAGVPSGEPGRGAAGRAHSRPRSGRGTW